ncbi:MAG: hypothetical protein ABEL76_02840 [Bradymonadaceae bacterium]
MTTRSNIGRFVALLVVGTVWLSAGVSFAATDDEHEIFVLTGGEVWAGEETGGHGVALVHWRWQPSQTPLRFDAQYNTDTVRLRLAGPTDTLHSEFYGALKAQYPFARMLPDYYRRGERVGARGFRAGYAAATAGWKGGWRPHWIDVSLTGRRWLFEPTEATASDLRLPPDTWSARLRASYALWMVLDDTSQWQPHQPFDRVEGFAAGLDLAVDLRADTRSWGDRGAANGVDPRVNRPSNPALIARQWGAVGIPLAAWGRLQLYERAAWHRGGDDLTRDRLGGLNPYVAPVAGLPWAALVSGRYATGRAELRLEMPLDHEFGIFTDTAAVADPRRSGARSELGLAAGAGLLADLRWGAWKVDLRLGTALPRRWLDARPLLNGWLSVGRRW